MPPPFYENLVFLQEPPFETRVSLPKHIAALTVPERGDVRIERGAGEQALR